MEISRSRSPGPNFRRYALNARRNTFDSGQCFFTSSLPTSAFQRMQFSQVEEDSISSKRNFNLSPPSPSVTMFQRPRSASLHQTPISLAGKKKSYRAISRSRPSSAKLGSGRHRSESLNFEQEAIAGTLKVEEQFAMIKTQLAKLSAEDMALQERLDRLASEITLVKRCASQLHTVPYRRGTYSSRISPCSIKISPPTTTPTTTVPTLLISHEEDHFGPLTEESWEEEYNHSPQHSHDSAANIHHVRMHSNAGREGSLGSCGSLADSEGPFSSSRATTPNVSLMVDQDRGSQPPSPLKLSFGCSEDDVFVC